MKKSFLFVLCISALSACAAKEPDKCPLTPLDTKGRQQEEMCKHFAGEEPYNAERAAFLKSKMEELNCGLFF